MNIDEFKKAVLSVDWTKFNGPELYNPRKVPEALIALAELKDSSQANRVGLEVVNAIGNNHSGTYYPVILEALDFIIMLEKNSVNNKTRKICSAAILNDLYYFEPELGSWSDCAITELKKIATAKLSPFSDDE